VDQTSRDDERCWNVYTCVEVKVMRIIRNVGRPKNTPTKLKESE